MVPTIDHTGEEGGISGDLYRIGRGKGTWIWSLRTSEKCNDSARWQFAKPCYDLLFSTRRADQRLEAGSPLFNIPLLRQKYSATLLFRDSRNSPEFVGGARSNDEGVKPRRFSVDGLHKTSTNSSWWFSLFPWPTKIIKLSWSKSPPYAYAYEVVDLASPYICKVVNLFRII